MTETKFHAEDWFDHYDRKINKLQLTKQFEDLEPVRLCDLFFESRRIASSKSKHRV